MPLPTYRSLAAPVRKPVDKFALLPAFLKVSMTLSFNRCCRLLIYLLPISFVTLSF
jgi:hypothetical protein